MGGRVSFDRGLGAARTGDSTGGRAHFECGDTTAEQIVVVPQIQEQNVEVIRVIPLECQENAFFLLKACGEEGVRGTLFPCNSTVSPARECWCALSASD